MTNTTFGRFDQHCATLLIALGYTCEQLPETWEDVGGPESGPRLVGGPACDVWSRPDGKGSVHVIVVEAGDIVEEELQPDFDGYLNGQFFVGPPDCKAEPKLCA
jgi:hypothetical protein